MCQISRNDIEVRPTAFCGLSIKAQRIKHGREACTVFWGGAASPVCVKKCELAGQGRPSIPERRVRVACGERKAGWPCSLIAHCTEQRPKVGNDIDHDASGGLKQMAPFGA